MSFLCSPFYGRACCWAMLGELKPKGLKGPDIQGPGSPRPDIKGPRPEQDKEDGVLRERAAVASNCGARGSTTKAYTPHTTGNPSIHAAGQGAAQEPEVLRVDIKGPGPGSPRPPRRMGEGGGGNIPWVGAVEGGTDVPC